MAVEVMPKTSSYFFSLFYAKALIDTENAFLKFLKTHVDKVRKRTEKVYENAQS